MERGAGGVRRRGMEATKTRFWMKHAPCRVREFHVGWSGWTVPPTMVVERVCGKDSFGECYHYSCYYDYFVYCFLTIFGNYCDSIAMIMPL